jgi:hypothetical protein
LFFKRAEPTNAGGKDGAKATFIDSDIACLSKSLCCSRKCKLFNTIGATGIFRIVEIGKWIPLGNVYLF